MLVKLLDGGHELRPGAGIGITIARANVRIRARPVFGRHTAGCIGQLRVLLVARQTGSRRRGVEAPWSPGPAQPAHEREFVSAANVWAARGAPLLAAELEGQPVAIALAVECAIQIRTLVAGFH